MWHLIHQMHYYDPIGIDNILWLALVALKQYSYKDIVTWSLYILILSSQTEIGHLTLNHPQKLLFGVERK